MRISLKWFLLLTVGIAILIAVGKRGYDAWQRRQWVAAPVIAGTPDNFSARRHRQWMAKQKEIGEALRGARAEWVGPDGYVTVVDVLPATDRRCLSILSEATELEEFNARTALADADLLWAENHPSLKRLLRIQGITNHSLAVIGTCRKLEQLSILPSSITDEGLAHLRGLDRLELLHLSGNSVNGPGLAPLSCLPRLSVLRLAACPIDDEELKTIGQLRQLELLDLIATKIDGRGLLHLTTLSKLRTLYLDYTMLEDSSGLAQLDSVQTLSLNEVQLTTGMLKDVSGMDSLESLSLVNSAVTDDLLTELSDADQIRELSLSNNPITDTGLIHLENMQGLREIKLRRTAVTEAGVRGLADALPKTQVIYDGGAIQPASD